MNDWQLLQYSFLLLALPFMVGLSFVELFRKKEKLMSDTCFIFFAIISFASWSQVETVLTFLSVYSVEPLILKCLRSNATKKLRVESLVPKLQSLFLLVTRRDVLLAHCSVPSVPISPKNLKMIWIAILRWNIAP